MITVTQHVMAYRAEQDRIRALLPDGFTSLRPVLRIDAELRTHAGQESAALELITPVTGHGKSGWLAVAHWDSAHDELTVRRDGATTTFQLPFLTISYTGVGIEGGCPAERSNDGCFFLDDGVLTFRPVEQLRGINKEFCDCTFAFSFAAGDAHGTSTRETLPAFLEPTATAYPRQALTAANAAAIPCEQVLGTYHVTFLRQGERPRLAVL